MSIINFIKGLFGGEPNDETDQNVNAVAGDSEWHKMLEG